MRKDRGYQALISPWKERAYKGLVTRLSETKMRSGSTANKQAAEVLTYCTNLTARTCMTVAKVLNLRGHVQEVK